MPSFILIRPVIWPQYTNVTDRTDGQDKQDRADNGLTAQGKPVTNSRPKTNKKVRKSFQDPDSVTEKKAILMQSIRVKHYSSYHKNDKMQGFEHNIIR